MSYRNNTYKWTLEEDLTIETKTILQDDVFDLLYVYYNDRQTEKIPFVEMEKINLLNFGDASGNESRFKRKITIKKCYSWDGASPKFKLFGRVWGTPDFGKVTYYATLIHDVFYQFSEIADGQGVTRKMIDQFFFEKLKEENFKLSRVYYIAVRIFGLLFWKRKK